MQSLWMVLAAAAFAAMGACVKAGAAQFHAFEMVLWRGVLGTLMMGGWAMARGVSLRSAHWRLHASRSAVGATALSAWYYALAHLPLAAAMTLNYTSPLWMALILSAAALLWRRGRFEPALVAAVLAGFGGVAMLLRPSFGEGASLPAAVGLASGAVSAAALLQVRALGRLGEPEWRIVFWFCVMQALFGAAGTAAGGLHDASAYDPRGLALLAGIAVCALVGQVSLTRAFGKGRALLTANLQYLGVVFGALIGWRLFGEALDAASVAGIAVILASSVAAGVFSSRGGARNP